jgi:RNA 3'-terminal phosphate cyclase (ATP)
VGQEAAEKLVSEINNKAPVDLHLADNLIPYLALFSGRINVSKLTNHTLTNINVCEHFFDGKFNLDKENNIIAYSK